MAESIEIQILDRIKKAGRGVIFFTNSFMAYGNAKAVSKALQRLVKAGEIDRVAAGIYVRPVMDTVIGKVSTSIEDIAKAIARRDRARIVTTGIYALNRLGLSTQVPLKVVFLTDGAARKIKIGNTNITFKKTAPKNVCYTVPSAKRYGIRASHLAHALVRTWRAGKRAPTEHPWE